MSIASWNALEFWASLSWSSVQSKAGELLGGPDRLALWLVWFSVAAAAVVTYYQGTAGPRSTHGLIRHMLPAGTLRHPSARADFLFWLSRRLFMPLLVVPLGLSTVTAGYGVYTALSWLFGVSAHVTSASTAVLCLFTLSMIIAHDLSYYIYHYLCHRLPILWELHKVHHSAQVMVGVTKDRVHPLDEILNRWWNGLIPGATYGIWLFFALDPIEVTVFGIGAYAIRSLLMMDVVRHTHLKFSYGPFLNRIFLCPHYHQLHHSIDPRHYNRNYGLLFSFWDRMFGTLTVPAAGQDFVFGLADREHEEYQSLARLHFVPIRNISTMMWRWCHALPRRGGRRMSAGPRPTTLRGGTAD